MVTFPTPQKDGQKTNKKLAVLRGRSLIKMHYASFRGSFSCVAEAYVLLVCNVPPYLGYVSQTAAEI